MTSELTPAQVADYLEASCALIESELKALGDDAGWHQAANEWCARAVVGHLIEAEKRGFAGRIRIILANDHPQLEGWDQVDIEKQRNDCARVTDSVWMEFMGLRQDSVTLVRSLKPADLDRGGIHPKVGELKVRWLLHEWISHDRNHTKQMLSIAQERVWPHMGNSQKFKGGVMPIHLRAQPGDYAEACLLPGDPLRAKYIAETYFADAKQVNGERGLLGYTGTYEGTRVSVQGTGMGSPGATIVFEELIQLGVKTLIRVGTCGGLQLGQKLGDTIVAISGVSADATPTHLVGNEPHSPTASFELSHAAVHAAEAVGQPVHVGPVASSDLFYNPDAGQYARWSKRGVLAVEMEAAALFTVAALRGVRGGCLLVVSDMVIDGTFTRISDAEMKAAVDRMTRVALAVAIGSKDALKV